MTTVINHDLRVVDGRTLVMPAWKGGQKGWGNLTPPDIRDTDSVQKYPVGTKLLDNERVFYYAKASSVGVSKTDYGVKNGLRQHIAYTTIAAVAVAGAKVIVIDVDTDDYNSGVIAANELAGGYVVVFNHDDDAFVCRILENTATSGAGEMTLTLQDELPVALAINVDHAECMAHPFFGCEWNEDPKEPVVGVAHAKVTANYWFWLQTWGLCWLSPQGDLGAEDSGHQATFRYNGNVQMHTYDDAYMTKAQHAGFVMAYAVAGTQGAPFIMLQICP